MTSPASIKQKIILNTTIKTISPLRIASGRDDGITDILILKNKKGQPFIPGTSIAGVLRSEILTIYGKQTADKIFGSINDNGNQSMINISDITLNQANIIHRDGVAIETYAGVSKQGAKYDYEAIDRGAQGTLTIELTVRKNDLQTCPTPTAKHPNLQADNQQYLDILATIADLITHGINIGSLTAKGYGKIQSDTPAQLYLFDFAQNQKQAPEQWLKYIQDNKLPQPTYTGNPQATQTQAPNTFEIEAHFAIKSSLIIRDAEPRKENDQTITVQLKSGKDYVIPGTSLKGVLRNRATQILTAICQGNEQQATTFINNLMGYVAENQKTARKSRLSVDEAYIKPNQITLNKQTRNRIDRFTGGTITGALFSEEALWQTQQDIAPVKIKLKITDATPAEAGLLLLVLKDLWLGQLPIGGGKSIGRGVLKGHKSIITYQGKTITINAQGRPDTDEHRQTLENYVKELVVKHNA